MLGCLLAASEVSADSDLRGLLAAPPSSDWLERSPTPQTLAGAFDAHAYDVFVADNGGSEDALKKYRFVAGYDREWEQKVTQDYLVERVFQFQQASGANYWYGDLKLDNQTTREFKRDIPALGATSSFGVQLDYPDGNHGYRIYFTRANLMVQVNMYSDTNDLSASVLSQAQAQYGLTPASGINVVATSNPTLSKSTAEIMGFAFIGLIVLVSAVLFALLRSSRRRELPATATAFGVPLSPDRFYWWDGARWRVVATDPPPKPPT